ncbi:exported hypothetical protein [Xenorhabdus bovienii str. kraussei Quebec]|uniref:Uncharacterized protein n=5 Tax=Xenorhabdus bovienii TaxID=40576 RepID=A0A077PM11_XENBV|nr:exported hypothetical protein [Xenorhabdus bovienii str. puntauvense]CDH02613.1 exported hypothetical protein [Xenorhabdus bovienii str. feltiae Moldova]CDH20779.1 exported hypothetical protein [Xenorhabdus bovienii str. kraussei Quebec]CDH22173.1 exported hypothetical protein [Xenorhabdus bovienii str. kraussei Becker Underwood]CDM87608.1 exported protein of unknown function [Xenorhabdus bovienii]
MFNDSSSRLTWILVIALLINSRSAARVNDPQSTTAIKV